jgi:hypothetical protein
VHLCAHACVRLGAHFLVFSYIPASFFPLLDVRLGVCVFTCIQCMHVHVHARERRQNSSFFKKKLHAPTTRMYAPTRKCSLSEFLRVVCEHVRECLIYLTRMCSLRVVC